MEGAWFVRADGGDAFPMFRDQGLVALGWKEAGRFDAKDADEAIEARFARAYPEHKLGARRVWAGQTRRFLREPKAGDAVVTYDPSSRVYLLGKIASEAVQWVENTELPWVRKVKWELQVSRDALSTASRNSLGSILTIFRISPEVADEMRSHGVALGAKIPQPSIPPEPVASLEPPDAVEREDTVAKASGLIEDRIMKLSPNEVPELVGGILRAMGYKTRVSKPGPDRGVDVFASPDGLGLQEPRIFVEVKHRSAAMGAPDLRAFLGGRKPGDRCIYVSTGGFTKEARYEADRSSIPLSLVDLERLRELLVDHYEKVDAETRTLVPLSRLYWPVE